MFNVRNGVFETNSSSTHSIAIMKRECATSPDVASVEKELDENGVWNLSYDDTTFGRTPFRLLFSFKDKILYAIANCCYARDFLKVTNAVRKLVPSFRFFNFDSEWDLGGTDDQILFGWLDKNDVELEGFLTDNRYFVICDGDECDIFKNMVQSGIVNKESFSSSFNYDGED